jgi:hypothetical protein
MAPLKITKQTAAKTALQNAAAALASRLAPKLAGLPQPDAK